MDKTYKQIREESKPIRDGNDCTVVVVSVMTGISYAEAQYLLCAAGRKVGKGVDKGIYHQVIKDLGFKIQELKQKYHPGSILLEGIRQITSKTVRTVERELAGNWGGMKVMIGCRAHVLAWNGKEIVDWTAGRGHRVTSAYLVYQGDMPVGRSVPVPERHSLNRVGCKRTSVMANILGNEPVRYQSCTAAYKALGLNKQGRQKIRRIVKVSGSCTFWGWKKKDSTWQKVHVTITLE